MATHGDPTPSSYGFQSLADELFLEIVRYMSHHTKNHLRRINTRFSYVVRLSLDHYSDHIAFDLASIALFHLDPEIPNLRAIRNRSPAVHSGYLSSFDRPCGKEFKTLLVYGSGQNDCYVFRSQHYLQVLSVNLKWRFPEVVYWANMRMDGYTISSEFSIIPPTTRVVLYRMTIFGVNWLGSLKGPPSAHRTLPHVLHIEGPDHLDPSTFRSYSPYGTEFSESIAKLTHKNSKPLTEKELQDLSYDIGSFYEDMKSQEQYPNIIASMHELIEKYDPDLHISFNEIGLPSSNEDLRRLQPFTLRLLEDFVKFNAALVSRTS